MGVTGSEPVTNAMKRNACICSLSWPSSLSPTRFLEMRDNYFSSQTRTEASVI